MNYYAIPPLVTCTIIAAIGLIVYHNNKRSRVNLIFALFCFSMVWWLAFYTLMYMSRDPFQALTWARIGFIGIIFIPVLAYHFITAFLDIRNRFVTVFIYVVSIPTLIVSQSFHVYQGLKDEFWGFYPIAGNYYFVFLIAFSLFFGSGVYLLWRAMSAPGILDIRKKQISYVFTAFGIGAFGVVDYIGKYKSVDIYPFGYVCALLFIAIIAYAIVRHRLMDIELIIKKTIVFAGLFLVSFAVVAFFVFIGTAIFEDVLNNRWMSLMPSVIVIVLIFRPVESFLRSTTDRFLFQKKYDYKDILKTFTGEVLTVLDLDDLGKLTVMKLVNIMKLDGASIILHDEKSGAYKYLVSEWPEKAAMGAIPDLQPLHSLLSSSGYYLKGSGPGPEQPGKHTPAAINMLAELRGELIIILRYSGKALGFILLGKKKSDEEFYQDDLDILLPLAHTLSIAITNAMLFDKLSETQAQAAQQEKMAVIGTLSAGINHEICNPLGIIRGQCEMFTLNMKDGLYKDKTPSELVVKALEIMNKVIKETDRATGITKKLSAFAKPAKGSIEDDVELLKELEEVISLIEHDCHLNDIVIVKDIPKDLPCISADRKQTQEILFNIIKNAAQAVKTKGTIIISATHRRGRVLIDIEDTGPGIEKEYLDRIFDPFFTTKAPGEGTGLGLFIVKQIIEKNNGFISVESKKGKGTVFHLAFMASDERAHGGG